MANTASCLISFTYLRRCQVEHHGAELLSGSILQQFLLAVSAGMFITFAAVLSAVLSAEM